MKVLVVGSSKIDLFFEVIEKSHIKDDGNNVVLSVGDKIPIDIKRIALGGNGANVSVGLKRLGHDTTFFTYFGNDVFSKEMEDIIKKEGINLKAQNIGDKSSLSLILDLEKDRIIFSHHEPKAHPFAYNDSGLPDFVYLISVGPSWEETYEEVLEFVKKNNIPLIFTPGSPQIDSSSQILKEVMDSAKIIFINLDEAKKLLKLQNIEVPQSPKDILLKIKSLGVEVVSVTDGLNGAYATSKNNDTYFIKPFGQEATERTGAGDSYASGFLAHYLLGLDVAECMRRGTFNANSVVSKVGAQEGLLTKEEIDKISEENKDFKAERI